MIGGIHQIILKQEKGCKNGQSKDSFITHLKAINTEKVGDIKTKKQNKEVIEILVQYRKVINNA